MNVEDLKRELAEHHAKIDLANCPHCCASCDNYGESCAHCGKQLKGYGFGGWFGGNLSGAERCLHDYVKNFYGDDESVRYCLIWFIIQSRLR
jgi:hypothetical protein